MKKIKLIINETKRKLREENKPDPNDPRNLGRGGASTNRTDNIKPDPNSSSMKCNPALEDDCGTSDSGTKGGDGTTSTGKKGKKGNTKGAGTDPDTISAGEKKSNREGEAEEPGGTKGGDQKKKPKSGAGDNVETDGKNNKADKKGKKKGKSKETGPGTGKKTGSGGGGEPGPDGLPGPLPKGLWEYVLRFRLDHGYFQPKDEEIFPDDMPGEERQKIKKAYAVWDPIGANHWMTVEGETWHYYFLGHGSQASKNDPDSFKKVSTGKGKRSAYSKFHTLGRHLRDMDQRARNSQIHLLRELVGDPNSQTSARQEILLRWYFRRHLTTVLYLEAGKTLGRDDRLKKTKPVDDEVFQQTAAAYENVLSQFDDAWADAIMNAEEGSAEFKSLHKVAVIWYEEYSKGTNFDRSAMAVGRPGQAKLCVNMHHWVKSTEQYIELPPDKVKPLDSQESDETVDENISPEPRLRPRMTRQQQLSVDKSSLNREDIKNLIKEAFIDSIYGKIPDRDELDGLEPQGGSESDFVDQWTGFCGELKNDRTKHKVIRLAKILIKDPELLDDVLELIGSSQSLGSHIMAVHRQEEMPQGPNSSIGLA